jgi:hypothetical protein
MVQSGIGTAARPVMQNREAAMCRPSVGGTAEKGVKTFSGASKQTI